MKTEELERARYDVLPTPYPVGRGADGYPCYIQQVRTQKGVEIWPVVPFHVRRFPPRRGWWKRTKDPWIDRFDQAWEFDQKFWKIVDVYRDSWKRRIIKNKSLRRAIQIDGTWRVLRSFKQLATGMSKKHEGGNVVFAIRGWKRTGKTYLGKILGKVWTNVMRDEYGIESDIKTVFGVNQVRKIHKKCNRGDFILCDESAKLTSSGAITAIINLVNILEISGLDQIAVGFIGPNFDFKSVGGALDMGFDVLGANFEHEMIRALVYDKEAEPLYCAGFQRNFLASEFPTYHEAKAKKSKAIREDDGAEEIWDEEEFQQDVARLVEYAKEEYAHQLRAKRFPRITSLEGDAKDLRIIGHSDYMKRVASKARDKLENYVYSLPDTKETPPDIRVEHIPDGEEERTHIFVPYLIAATNAYVSQPRFRANKRAIRRFTRFYFENLTYQDIAELESDENNDDPDYHRVTANNIGKAVRGLRKKLNNNDVGAIGELAVMKFLESRLPQTLSLVRGRRCGCLESADNDIDLGVGDEEGERFVAVNVKLFLSERDGSVIHCSPEFRHSPHMCVVVEVRRKEGLRVEVLLNGPEVETQAQAREEGRVVDLERMVGLLTFGIGSPAVGAGEEAFT